MQSVGIDVGGTFTDFVLVDSSGSVSVYKRLTTPSDPSRGVLEGLGELAELHERDLRIIARFIHGTTLVANSIIERRGSPTALITTKGFADVLEIGREARYDLYDLNLERPEPLVPRPLRFEVPERVLADGSELEPLDEAAARELVRRLADLGIESVAISLLHSYANPAHEQRIAEIVAEEAPSMEVSLSSDVAPEWREFERTSTTVANAYVKPLVRRYMAHLEKGLSDFGSSGQLFVMLSQGGVTSASLASELAIQLVESGPAGGVMAAVFLGRRRGIDNLISFDMGGTTAKVSLIERGVPLQVPEIEVARMARLKRGSGLPLKLPTIEITEIGTGGGSIGHRDPLGLLKVGPLSAGADPGPACYGKGEDATVTDADLHLGYLNAAYFLGGTMELYPDRSTAALRTLGESLGIGAEQCARRDIRRGQPSDGTGHPHQCRRARTRPEELHSGCVRWSRTRACIRDRPPAANRQDTLPARGGCGIGLGISRLTVRHRPVPDPRRTHRQARLDQGPRRFDEMDAQALDLLERAGADPSSVQFQRRVDMRYSGQGYEVPVTLPAAELDSSIEKELRGAFDAAYEHRYGAHLDDSPAEALHWRLTATVTGGSEDISFPGGIGRRRGERRAARVLPRARGLHHRSGVRPVPPRRRQPGQGADTDRRARVHDRDTGPSATWVVDVLGNVSIYMEYMDA